MSNLFRAHPGELKNAAGKLDNQKGQFQKDVKLLYDTVHEMINSSYLSPAALELARKIESYHEDMNKMTKIIGDYSDFCGTASGEVIKNEEAIIDTFKNVSDGF